LTITVLIQLSGTNKQLLASVRLKYRKQTLATDEHPSLTIPSMLIGAGNVVLVLLMLFIRTWAIVFSFQRMGTIWKPLLHSALYWFIC